MTRRDWWYTLWGMAGSSLVHDFQQHDATAVFAGMLTAGLFVIGTASFFWLKDHFEIRRKQKLHKLELT